MFSLQWKTLVSLQVRLFVNSYGTSQILWPSLESQCTAGTRVELPHINCASDHRWTYPSCGQQSRFCGSTHTTNSPSIQLLHTIYIYRFLLRLRLSLLHFVTLRTQYWRGTWWSSWFRHCATSRRVAGSISDGGHLDLSLKYSFRQHCGLGVDSPSNRNEYQGKGGRNVGLKTLSRNSGSLKFLFSPAMEYNYI